MTSNVYQKYIFFVIRFSSQSTSHLHAPPLLHPYVLKLSLSPHPLTVSHILIIILIFFSFPAFNSPSGLDLIPFCDLHS